VLIDSDFANEKRRGHPDRGASLLFDFTDWITVAYALQFKGSGLVW
jgi:hypothetical protein